MNTPESFALPNQRGSLGFRVSAEGGCCRLAVRCWHAQHGSHFVATSSRVIGQINLPYRQGKLHGNSPRHPPILTYPTNRGILRPAGRTTNFFKIGVVSTPKEKYNNEICNFENKKTQGMGQYLCELGT